MRSTLSVAVALVLALAGCRTVPQAGEPREFEFPFVNDYSVVNRATFRWSDTFLTNRCDVYQQDLAGPLSALASSVYGFRMFMDVRSLYALGFAPENMYRRYGRDIDYGSPVYGRNQVGFTIAAKRVFLDGAFRDVLFVVVRGTFGRDEWLSNMNACDSWGMGTNRVESAIPRLHEGFRLAADAVEEALLGYVASNRVRLATAKVVVTGHSRGAAVANILGARLDDYASSPSGSPLSEIRRENIYVYTYATPNTVRAADGVEQSGRYGNIFNIINPEDIVPRVPIVRWDYRRFGRDLNLYCYDDLSLWGVWYDGAYCRMKESFREITGYEWWHMPLGTNSTAAIPSFLGAMAPTVGALYSVPPGMEREPYPTTAHSIVEYALFRTMADPAQNEREVSLGGDVAKISEAYSSVEDPGEADAGGRYFFTPDGHDYSRQPGMLDIPWRIACMHATQTYVSWMKAAEEYGLERVFTNPPDDGGAVSSAP